MREAIGKFEVIDSNRYSLQVTVSQEIHIDIHGIMVDHRKIYTLADTTDEEIVPTNDPKIFLKQDGSQLRKIGYVKTGA